jgi:hypothetical protein
MNAFFFILLAVIVVAISIIVGQRDYYAHVERLKQLKADNLLLNGPQKIKLLAEKRRLAELSWASTRAGLLADRHHNLSNELRQAYYEALLDPKKMLPEPPPVETYDDLY